MPPPGQQEVLADLSVAIAPDSSGGGNTQTPPNSTKTKQTPSRKNHFFTYNNYKIEEIAPIVATLQRFAYKGKIQTEVGKNGTPHLQGMIWCHKKHRDTEFKLPKQIHWEKLEDEHNKRDYCAKDESHDGIFRTEWGFPKPVKLIEPNRPYQVEIVNIIQTEPDDRKVYWFYEPDGGVGKSSLCKYLCAKHNALYIDEGKKSDLINIIFNADMDKHNIIVIDVPRSNGNTVSYKAIEQIKNGMICNTKYETGMKLFNPPHLIVFSNSRPDLTMLSEDRWVVHRINTDFTLSRE